MTDWSKIDTLHGYGAFPTWLQGAVSGWCISHGFGSARDWNWRGQVNGKVAVVTLLIEFEEIPLRFVSKS